MPLRSTLDSALRQCRLLITRHTLHTVSDAEGCLDIPTLSAIGRFHHAPGSAFPTNDHTDAQGAYRQLAKSLKAHGGARTVLVTSARPEEGKSTTAANLATVLAQTGSKVVLVDADFRWSSLRSPYATAMSLGLSGLLLNHCHTPQSALVATNEPGLFLLPAGVLPPEPAELLSQPRLGDVIALLREKADYVILDSPAVLEAEDARLLASNVDATLLVMRAGKTRAADVQRAITLLQESGAGLLGAVLNQARRSELIAPSTVPPTPVLEATSDLPGAEPPSPATIDELPAFLRVPREPAVAIPGATYAADMAPNGIPESEPRLRLVPPDERPALPVVNEWAPAWPAPPSTPHDMPARATSPASKRLVTAATSGRAGRLHAVPEAAMAAPSVDDVMARMEGTLRIVREIRPETAHSESAGE